MRTPLALAVLALAGGLAATADPPPAAVAPRPAAGDEVDLLLLHDSRPWRVRLHLQVDGRSFRAGWEAAAGTLFRYLDADGDGVLSPGEGARAPSAAQWQELQQGALVLEADAAPDLAELRGPAGGPVKLANFIDFYRRTPGGPLHLEWGPAVPPSDVSSEALFQLLDRDRDGKLSRSEVEEAPALLARLDGDGDEMLTVNEMFEGVRAAGSKLPATGAGKPEPAPLAVVDPAEPVRTLVGWLLRTYDRDGNRRLARGEVAFSRELFDRLDTNKDGELDESELARWRQEPADLELLVPLTVSAPSFTLLAGPAGKWGPLSAALVPDGTLFVSMPGMRLEMLSLEAAGGGGAQRLRENLRASFKTIDANKDGVLDSREMYAPPFTFVGLSRLADRDGDGKLSERELTDYLAMQEKVVTATTFLTFVNRGRSLFEFLDSNRDGRLSRRELQTAWGRLAAWDLDGDGSVARAEVPRQYLLAVGHGRSPLAEAGGGADAARAFRPPARAVGPLWFRKMDRNGDGDLSPHEFLGTAEQFRRLDADGDGLISAEEAERADRQMRKKK
jgi:Ca2+-binding EF-hand superfamily protein